MFVKELGKSPEEIFADFDEEPIGAASLAQVHHAVLHTGEEVAVKVQYPSVEFVYKSDIKAIELVFRSIKWVRGYSFFFFLWR
jgi:predicted unusual protein kinase regulating ubiquinone biosynthesis (AarF/ABC1/UbiB family)